MLMLLVILTGCMYPQSQKVENSIPNDVQLQMVQTAVEQYRQDTEGLLPIKNQEADVPYYQKYPIDFQKLIGKNYKIKIQIVELWIKMWITLKVCKTQAYFR